MKKKCIRRVVDSKWCGSSEPQIKYTSKHRRVVTWKYAQWLWLKLECGHETRGDYVEDAEMFTARCDECEEMHNLNSTTPPVA